MKIPHVKILSGVACALIGTSAFADQATSISQQVQTVDKRTQLLEQQVTELRTKLNEMNTTIKPEETKPSTLDDEALSEAVRAHSLVSFGPYLNIRTQFNGSELIVNTPSIRESSRLLLNRYKNEQAARAAGKPMPSVPRIELSGVLGGQVFYGSGYDAGKTSNVDLTDAEIDTYVVMNDWISGFMAVVYDNGTGGASRAVDNANVEISKAFITLGDLGKTPYYTSLGQLYVPFGRYSSSMVSSPLTKKIGRIKERALVAGYKDTETNAFFGELYAFKASSGFSSERSTVNDAGIDIGYDFTIDDRISGEMGAGIISTIADSDGIQDGSSVSGGFSGLSCSSCSEVLDTRVPGVDVYAKMNYDPFTLIAEYVTATHKFDKDSGFLYRGEGAKPAAQNVELAYTLHIFDKPSSVAVGYGHSSQAAMLGLPNRRYSFAYNVSLWKHTLETIEFRRDYNYGNSVSSDVSGDSLDNLGIINNVITAQIYVYF